MTHVLTHGKIPAIEAWIGHQKHCRAAHRHRLLPPLRIDDFWWRPYHRDTTGRWLWKRADDRDAVLCDAPDHSSYATMAARDELHVPPARASGVYTRASSSAIATLVCPCGHEQAASSFGLLAPLSTWVEHLQVCKLATAGPDNLPLVADLVMVEGHGVIRTETVWRPIEASAGLAPDRLVWERLGGGGGRCVTHAGVQEFANDPARWAKPVASTPAPVSPTPTLRLPRGGEPNPPPAFRGGLPGTFSAGVLSCPCGHLDFKATFDTVLDVWLKHLQVCTIGVDANDPGALPLLAELELVELNSVLLDPGKTRWTPVGRDGADHWVWKSDAGRQFVSRIADPDTGYANDPDVWREHAEEDGGEDEDYEEAEAGGEDEVESEDEYGGVFPRARKMEEEVRAATRAAARQDGRLLPDPNEEALAFFDLRGKFLTNAVLEGSVAMWRRAGTDDTQRRKARASYHEELTRVFAEAGVPLTPSGVQACWEERFATVSVEDGLRAQKNEAKRLPLPGPMGPPPAPEVWGRAREEQVAGRLLRPEPPAIDSPLLGHCARLFKQLADELQALNAPEASYFAERESQLQTRMKAQRETHDKELTRLFAAGGIDVDAYTIQQLWGQRLVALGKEAEKEVRAKSKTVSFAYATTTAPGPVKVKASPLIRRVAHADRLVQAKANAHIIGSDTLIAEDAVLKATADRWRSYKKGWDIAVASLPQTNGTRARAEEYLRQMAEAHDAHQTRLSRLVEERYPALTSDLAVFVATLAVIWEQRTKRPAADAPAATVQSWSLAEQQRRWEQVLIQTALDLYPAVDKAKAEAGAPVEKKKFKSPMFVKPDPEQEPQKLKEPVMPIENETPVPTPTHPTLGLAIEGGKRGGKMILSVQAMRAVQTLVRKIAAKYLPPEHLPLLDTPFGQAVVDMLSPLVIHALAEHGYMGDGKAKELTQATAEYAYEGQVFRHGLLLTDTMANLTVDFAESFAEIRKIGMQLVEEPTDIRDVAATRVAANAARTSNS